MKNKYTIIELIIISLLVLLIFDFLAEKGVTYDGISKEDETDYINEMYETSPELFEFDGNGKAIVYIRNFTYEETNNIRRSIIFDKDLNECDGYYIVYKNNDKLEVDVSHLCDMLDE